MTYRHCSDAVTRRRAIAFTRLKSGRWRVRDRSACWLRVSVASSRDYVWSPKRSSASEGADRESACQRDAISARRGRLTTASTWPHKAARADGARGTTPRYCSPTKRRSCRSAGCRPERHSGVTRPLCHVEGGASRACDAMLDCRPRSAAGTARAVEPYALARERPGSNRWWTPSRACRAPRALRSETRLTDESAAVSLARPDIP